MDRFDVGSKRVVGASSLRFKRVPSLELIIRFKLQLYQSANILFPNQIQSYMTHLLIISIRLSVVLLLLGIV